MAKLTTTIDVHVKADPWRAALAARCLKLLGWIHWYRTELRGYRRAYMANREALERAAAANREFEEDAKRHDKVRDALAVEQMAHRLTQRLYNEQSHMRKNEQIRYESKVAEWERECKGLRAMVQRLQRELHQARNVNHAAEASRELQGMSRYGGTLRENLLQTAIGTEWPEPDDSLRARLMQVLQAKPTKAVDINEVQITGGYALDVLAAKYDLMRMGGAVGEGVASVEQ
jgi:uncharacterized phage protein gp47/JayE